MNFSEKYRKHLNEAVISQKDLLFIAEKILLKYYSDVKIVKLSSKVDFDIPIYADTIMALDIYLNSILLRDCRVWKSPDTKKYYLYLGYNPKYRTAIDIDLTFENANNQELPVPKALIDSLLELIKPIQEVQNYFEELSNKYFPSVKIDSTESSSEININSDNKTYYIKLEDARGILRATSVSGDCSVSYNDGENNIIGCSFADAPKYLDDAFEKVYNATQKNLTRKEEIEKEIEEIEQELNQNSLKGQERTEKYKDLQELRRELNSLDGGK